MELFRARLSGVRGGGRRLLSRRGRGDAKGLASERGGRADDDQLRFDSAWNCPLVRGGCRV